MVLFLGEQEVREILTMEDAIKVLEDTFREQGRGNIINNPRGRIRTGKSMLHYMAGAVPHMNVMGYKAYTSYKGGFKFRVFLHKIDTGELISIMDGDYMGMIRTGAATGVATKYMANKDMDQAGIFGTGFQAKGQLMATVAVSDVQKIMVYSRNKENRESFAGEMEKLLKVEVIPVENPQHVIKGSSVIITSTTSFDPVFDGDLLEEGTHINAIGGNFLFKREIDEKTVKRSDIIVVDSIEQAKIEAGELLPFIEKGRLHWHDVYELGDVVSGKIDGRQSDEDITLFKSLGIAVEDVAVAAHIYNIAKEGGVGKQLEIPSF